MKTFILILTLVPQIGLAKVSDFNEIIAQNIQEQQLLKKEIQNQAGIESNHSGKAPIVIADNESETIQAQTPKMYVTFRKELQQTKKQKATSKSEQFDRIAQEVDQISE